MTDWFDPRALFGDQHLSIADYLPLQTQSSMTAPTQQKPPSDDSDLPVIPQGSLRDALIGKFDDPEIPSGIPDEKQQQQAFTHRLIGNAVGDTVSNLQNTANILKPGAGNPAMGESSRRFGDMLAEHALGNAKARRDEALQNFQIKDAADQRHEKMFQMATALKQQQDLRNPNSQLSRAAQQQELERLNAMMAVNQNHEINKQLLEKMRLTPSLSAEQLAGRSKNDPTEHMIEFDTTAQTAADKANRDTAKDAATVKRQDAETSLGNRRLAAEEKHWAQESVDKENNKNKLQLNEDKKAEEDIANLRNAKAELDRHIANMRSGKVSNDKPDVYGSQVANFVSSLGIPGVSPKSNPELQNMLTSIPLAQATAEKAVTGSARYTPQRWLEFAVQPGEGTQRSVNKLTGGSRYLDELIKERMTQLHTNAAGAPTSQSAMAKSFPEGAIPNTAAQVQARTQTGATPATGAIKNIKGGGKAQQQPDGSWKRIE